MVSWACSHISRYPVWKRNNNNCLAPSRRKLHVCFYNLLNEQMTQSNNLKEFFSLRSYRQQYYTRSMATIESLFYGTLHVRICEQGKVKSKKYNLHHMMPKYKQYNRRNKSRISIIFRPSKIIKRGANTQKKRTRIFTEKVKTKVSYINLCLR